MVRFFNFASPKPKKKTEPDKVPAKKNKGPKRISNRECPICGYVGKFTSYGGYYIRPDARCGGCRSLERHRLLKLWVDENKERLTSADVIHFAPEASVAKFVKPLAANYSSADLFRKNVDHNWNIEEIDCEDSKFDMVFCSHVLEHVDSDKALSELFRILRPKGIALVMIPICEGLDETYENPRAVEGTDTDRWMHFQQRDHIRLFGKDFREQVRRIGFDLSEKTAHGEDAVKYGLIMGEKVFVLTKP